MTSLLESRDGGFCSRRSHLINSNCPHASDDLPAFLARFMFVSTLWVFGFIVIKTRLDDCVGSSVGARPLRVSLVCL